MDKIKLNLIMFLTIYLVNCIEISNILDDFNLIEDLTSKILQNSISPKLCLPPKFKFKNFCIDFCYMNTVPDYLLFTCYPKPTYCSTITCLNGGICQMKFNTTISCNCSSNYSGELCEIPNNISYQIFSNISYIIKESDSNNILFKLALIQNSGYKLSSIPSALIYLQNYFEYLRNGNSFINTTNLLVCALIIKENIKNNEQDDVLKIFAVISNFSLNSAQKSQSSILSNTSDFTIQVFNKSRMNFIDSQMHYNLLPTVNLSLCVNSIESKYNLNQDSIFIFKIDALNNYRKSDDSIIIDWFSYFIISNSANNETFNIGKECQELPDIISFPSDNYKLNYSEINNYLREGINLLDPDSPFFVDRCIPISTNSTDLTISQRIDYYYKGFRLICSNGCTFNGFDKNNYTQCKCTNSTYTNLTHINTPIHFIENSNLYVIMCGNILFTPSIKQNIGFYQLCFFVLFEFLMYIYLYYNNNQFLFENVNEILRNDAKILNTIEGLKSINNNLKKIPFETKLNKKQIASSHSILPRLKKDVIEDPLKNSEKRIINSTESGVKIIHITKKNNQTHSKKKLDDVELSNHSQKIRNRRHSHLNLKKKLFNQILLLRKKF